MERFIPTKIWRKKGNSYRGTTFFSLLPERPEISVPFGRIGYASRETNLELLRWQIQVRVFKEKEKTDLTCNKLSHDLLGHFTDKQY